MVRTSFLIALMFVVSPFQVLSQDTAKTTYRTGYRGVCRSSVRFPDSPPSRYWCRVPNGRAIRIPIEPANVGVLTEVSVCAVEGLTLREDDAPCGFPGAVLLWRGAPTEDLEISNAGVSFQDASIQPDEIFVAVELNWNGTFPDEGNLFSVGYGNESRALRAIKVRVEGDPNRATRTPAETKIRIGEEGYIQLLTARKSQTASWFPQGQAMLINSSQTYYLSRGVARRVPQGEYEFLTNGFLPERNNTSPIGFLEVELEYETGPLGP